MSTFRAHHGGTGQAKGLRELFGPCTTSAYCLPSTRDVKCTTHALANARHRNLRMGEVALSRRRQLPIFACPVPCDPGHGPSGFVSTGQALRGMNEKLRHSIGTHARSAPDAHQTRPPSCKQHRISAQLDIDFMLIASRAPRAASLALHAKDVRRIALAGLDAASSKKSMEFVRDLSVFYPDHALPLQVVGGDNDKQGHQAFNHIATPARARFGVEVLAAGWIPEAALGNMDADMMLPDSLYRALDVAVSTMEPA